MYKC
jgi:hypothetical protein